MLRIGSKEIRTEQIIWAVNKVFERSFLSVKAKLGPIICLITIAEGSDLQPIIRGE